MSSQKHVLILGIPRSGTSLLSAIVGAHPKCIIMRESIYNEEKKILNDKKYIGNKLCVPNQIQLHQSKNKAIFDEDIPPFWLRVARHIYEKRIKQRILERSYVNTWLDRPKSLMSIKNYVEKYESSILIIARNPNHVVDSLVRNRSNTVPEKQIERWAHGIRELRETLKLYKKRCHVVRFESLVKEPEKESEKICEFLRISYERSMLKGPKLMKMRKYKEKNKGIDGRASSRETKNYKIEKIKCKEYEMFNEIIEKS
jgi:hypothetical protein